MSLPVSNSSVPTSYRHPFWGGSLRTTSIVSTITIIVLRPFGHIRGIGRWGRGVHSRRWSSFGVGGDLLTHLLFFIGVAEDDDVVIAGQPKEPTVEFAEESSDGLFIP
jgi:hypothetical protein